MDDTEWKTIRCAIVIVITFITLIAIVLCKIHQQQREFSTESYTEELKDTEVTAEMITTESVTTELTTEAVTTEEIIEKPKEAIEKIVFSSERRTAVRSATPINEGDEVLRSEINEDGYGWVQLQYRATYGIRDNLITKDAESIECFGHTETWCNITDCVIPDRHIADDGTVRDEDGFIAVASNGQLYSIVMTSVGPGKVYKKVVDDVVRVYTNWR